MIRNIAKKIKNIAKKIKNIIWYSSFYDFDNNCIVRNKRIDLIDWIGIIEAITTIAWIIAYLLIGAFIYYIAPYIIAFLIWSVKI